jgi:hypothetical protein
LELAELGPLTQTLLSAMGAELANVHSAKPEMGKKILRDLSKRRPKWLQKAITRTAVATIAEWKEYRRSSR